MRDQLPSGTPTELAVPDGTPARGVVVIPDIGGMRPLFDDLAARLAAEKAWAVAVVEPFPGRDLATIDDRFAAVPTLTDDRVLGDVVAAADLLESRTGAGRVAVIGFCMGGMYAYKAASTGRFDRAVPFYGMIRVPAAWRSPFQREPLDCLGDPRTCPVLAIIGSQDPYTPPEDVAELRRFGPLVTTVTFPEAEHGFVHDPSRPAHRPDDAAAAWRQVYDFLR
jgi:carboxymethylenebutenolidase